MKGEWEGEYWFTKKAPNFLLNRKTKFHLSIDSIENFKIYGTVKDNLETGGTKGEGTISGEINGNKIVFVKQMPISTMVLPNGKIIEENKPHRPIYYQGNINPETNFIKGTWTFKKGIRLTKTKLLLFKSTGGEWEMRKLS